jgi:hypothetical protein
MALALIQTYILYIINEILDAGNGPAWAARGWTGDGSPIDRKAMGEG